MRHNVRVALVVRLVAKPGLEETVASFLAGAEPLARSESFTPAWFALRTSPSVFYIVDAFANDADRDLHLTGEIAKALMAKAGELLAEPPAIEKADVLGAKLAWLGDDEVVSQDGSYDRPWLVAVSSASR